MQLRCRKSNNPHQPECIRLRFRLFMNDGSKVLVGNRKTLPSKLIDCPCPTEKRKVMLTI